jgi:hypothetical protein
MFVLNKVHSPKTEPMINEKFYMWEEFAEIKELLPEILEIVEKLEKYRGLSKLRLMKINFTNRIKPFWIRQRFLSDKEIKLFMDTIIKFMELGLVRELTSEEMYRNFNFQILKVPKVNGEFSVLLDLLLLNDEFQFEIPNLNNIIKRLSGFRFYCLINIAKAYCQLAYTSESGE